MLMSWLCLSIKWIWLWSMGFWNVFESMHVFCCCCFVLFFNFFLWTESKMCPFLPQIVSWAWGNHIWWLTFSTGLKKDLILDCFFDAETILPSSLSITTLTNHSAALLTACLKPIYSLHPRPFYPVTAQIPQCPSHSTTLSPEIPVLRTKHGHMAELRHPTQAHT